MPTVWAVSSTSLTFGFLLRVKLFPYMHAALLACVGKPELLADEVSNERDC
jgi:hypothetical protein